MKRGHGPCHETVPGDPFRCRQQVAWLITMMSGTWPYCEQHAKFYLERGPKVYPAKRIER